MARWVQQYMQAHNVVKGDTIKNAFIICADEESVTFSGVRPDGSRVERAILPMERVKFIEGTLYVTK